MLLCRKWTLVVVVELEAAVGREQEVELSQVQVLWMVWMQ